MNALIHAGMLKERVLFQQEARSADGIGGFQSAWEAYATRWAYVQLFNGASTSESDTLRSRVTKRVTIRRDDGVNASMRCILNSSIYRIEWVATSVFDPRFTECRISTAGESSL